MIKKAVDSTSPLIVEIETDPAICAEVAARRRRCEANQDWLRAHAGEAFAHRGKYICIAGQELFVADSPEEVLRTAASAHPEDDGRFALYIPLDKAPRIYAC